MLVLAAGMGPLGGAPAVAQDSPFGFFRRLFSRPEPEYVRPRLFPPPQQRVRPRRHVPAANRATRPTKPPEPAAVEKQADAKTVLVVGDFVASGLADGLAAAYAQTPAIRIVDRTSGSSGLVRDDFYDWPKKIGDLLAKEKPAAVVMMLGANDRQQMNIEGERQPAQSDAWTAEYEKRAERFAKTVEASGIPLLWVGMPAFRSESMSSDMLALNDLFQRAVADGKADYVDLWDGFADENGDFVVNGPDVNGQSSRLRADDGIGFSKAGKQKLAFYVEKPLDKILGIPPENGGTGAPGQTGPATSFGTPPGEASHKQIDQTPPISLADPGGDGAQDLLGGDISTLPAARIQVGATTHPGRADDFGGTAAAPAAQANVPASAAAAGPPPTPSPPAAIGR